MSKKLEISLAHKTARQFNGKCLSLEYSNVDSKLKWECSNGHIFQKSLYDVKNRERWCPRCEKVNHKEESCRCIFETLTGKQFERTRNILPGKYELDGYNAELHLAFEYNGEQHYRHVPKFKNSNSDLLKRKQIDNIKQILCNKLKIFLITIPFTEARNKQQLIDYIKSELKKCNIEFQNTLVDFSKIPISQSRLLQAKNIAISRNGELLSNEYFNVHSPMEWKCYLGHTWKASISSIKSLKTWCPTCASQKVTIEDLQDLAKNKNGFCISNEYLGAYTKLQWRCQNGHEWKMSPDAVKQGRWCRLCKIKIKNNVKDTIEIFQIIAKNHGGKCLSNEYIDNKHKLKFECSFGHQWESIASHIKHSKSWCKKCVYEKRKRNENFSYE